MSDCFLDESVILTDIEAKTKEQALEIVAQNLVDLNLVKKSFIPAIIQREAEYPTGLPTNGVSVAIPHTDDKHVKTETISLAILKRPVDFFIMGDGNNTTPVQLIFMLAMNEPNSQLSLLQKLMQIFQDEKTLTYIVSQKNKTDIKNLLKKKLGIT
ncbi:PTS galactitol transporter subunit IIA [Virgibacillus pantothenticus]|uniref:PTS sugar transporter subunit IIA n=1 Tax=Virgibacillus pantothenticus TaxID=1473 RepID=A0A0L0QMD2_VIRPA|nr:MULTISPECIES: PTS sugar transporter subunit IIA [Virgibacillus]API93128.1 PTS sugar transporter subunit IIA [Virgibacillus sp. 6R]KNE19423.1 PTS sugar transporter subunit IIA [Virgibacillus pantothenticus]MBS7428836.1 PTS sugar transporter subunit IIA [Virgibacillus sp. 19R1-5]MBU8568458.1 PTS sugar transporter subunit IIA [Virgibacillus pantothenticus]MBU8602455.1 PTS sugar transporter subunit IIA [Virgibacillus pantothenticus]